MLLTDAVPANLRPPVRDARNDVPAIDHDGCNLDAAASGFDKLGEDFVHLGARGFRRCLRHAVDIRNRGRGKERPVTGVEREIDAFPTSARGTLTAGMAELQRDFCVGIRVYKITLAQGMKPGEYAFFMGTGQQSSMAGGSSGGARSGGSAAGRVYDFRIPD